jgi:hypothetical protein
MPLVELTFMIAVIIVRMLWFVFVAIPGYLLMWAHLGVRRLARRPPAPLPSRRAYQAMAILLILAVFAVVGAVRSAVYR